MSKTAIIVFSLALLCAAGVVCLGSAIKNQKGFKSLTNKEFEKAGILNSSKENIENTLGNIYEDVIIPREFLA